MALSCPWRWGSRPWRWGAISTSCQRGLHINLRKLECSSLLTQCPPSLQELFGSGFIGIGDRGTKGFGVSPGSLDWVVPFPHFPSAYGETEAHRGYAAASRSWPGSRTGAGTQVALCPVCHCWLRFPTHLPTQPPQYRVLSANWRAVEASIRWNEKSLLVTDHILDITRSRWDVPRSQKLDWTGGPMGDGAAGSLDSGVCLSTQGHTVFSW